jgi:phosphopantothenoylcysteine decarboxylase/phosphopantothenate--cysteine ligase
LPTPYGVEVVSVITTCQLRDAIAKSLPRADVILMAAAPSDYSAGEPAGDKLKRENGTITLRLEPTPDVLKSTADLRREKCVAVGFALETTGGVERARVKLELKQLDLIVLNSASDPESGFETETNRVTLVTKSETDELPLLSKQQVAQNILDRVENLL